MDFPTSAMVSYVFNSKWSTNKLLMQLKLAQLVCVCYMLQIMLLVKYIIIMCTVGILHIL